MAGASQGAFVVIPEISERYFLHNKKLQHAAGRNLSFLRALLYEYSTRAPQWALFCCLETAALTRKSPAKSTAKTDSNLAIPASVSSDALKLFLYKDVAFQAFIGYNKYVR